VLLVEFGVVVEFYDYRLRSVVVVVTLLRVRSIAVRTFVVTVRCCFARLFVVPFGCRSFVTVVVIDFLGPRYCVFVLCRCILHSRCSVVYVALLFTVVVVAFALHSAAIQIGRFLAFALPYVSFRFVGFTFRLLHNSVRCRFVCCFVVPFFIFHSTLLLLLLIVVPSYVRCSCRYVAVSSFYALLLLLFIHVLFCCCVVDCSAFIIHSTLPLFTVHIHSCCYCSFQLSLHFCWVICCVHFVLGVDFLLYQLLFVVCCCCCMLFC